MTIKNIKWDRILITSIIFALTCILLVPLQSLSEDKDMDAISECIKLHNVDAQWKKPLHISGDNREGFCVSDRTLRKVATIFPFFFRSTVTAEQYILIFNEANQPVFLLPLYNSNSIFSKNVNDAFNIILDRNENQVPSANNSSDQVFILDTVSSWIENAVMRLK